jgi:dipeptidyl aminopeptidase/acylaminoacyl peptidase
MMNLDYLINKGLLFVSILILLVSFGCKTTDGASLINDESPHIPQDLNALKDSNGKIVEVIPVNVTSKRSFKTDCYKIKYLSDGLYVVGFVVKPKGDGSKFPVIIFNRGGNREFGKITEEKLTYLSYLSSKGYVILASQYRGNDGGWGREEFGGKDVNDVSNIIKLAKSLPFVNPSKIVMLGYSRGGMMTCLAIKHGADIKAAAIVGGLTDVEQAYNRDEGMKRVIRVLVGTDKSEWEKRSAVYWPEKIDVPLLILHGENDWRAKPSQVIKLSEKLTEEGKVNKLVIYPKGDHGLNTHQSARDREIFKWFDKYLN